MDDYHRLISSGILGEDDRVELLEGWIVPKVTHNPVHDGTIQIVSRRLLKRMPAGWDLRIQSAITTLDSEPEPDLALVRGDEKTYLQRHPGPADVGVLIEVAESSLETDRSQKARLYARAGVAVYWIVNLLDRQIEVYTNPIDDADPSIGPSYRQRQTYRGADVVPLVLAGVEVSRLRARDLLPE